MGGRDGRFCNIPGHMPIPGDVSGFEIEVVFAFVLMALRLAIRAPSVYFSALRVFHTKFMSVSSKQRLFVLTREVP